MDFLSFLAFICKLSNLRAWHECVLCKILRFSQRPAYAPADGCNTHVFSAGGWISFTSGKQFIRYMQQRIKTLYCQWSQWAVDMTDWEIKTWSAALFPHQWWRNLYAGNFLPVRVVLHFTIYIYPIVRHINPDGPSTVLFWGMCSVLNMKSYKLLLQWFNKIQKNKDINYTVNFRL